MGQSTLANWLKGRMGSEGLSLRGAATKTHLSHATIADILNGGNPSPDTVKKLAQGFGDGDHQRQVIEDQLLLMCNYRSERPEENLSESLALLMDRLVHFSEAELKIMEHFAEFISKTRESNV